MTGLIDRSIVRVFSAGPNHETPLGVGFIIGSGLVVTCAHVVQAATGKTTASVGDNVTIDFPMIGKSGRSSASVTFTAGGSGGSGGKDIAGLSVDAMPPGARAVRVVAAADGAGHRVQAFGTTATRPDGVWSQAELGRPIGGGVLQAEDARDHGVPIQPGFSGSPLIDLDLGAVIGMVTHVEAQTARRVAYALSGQALHDAWPRLADPAVVPSPFRSLEPFQPADADCFFGRDEYARRIAGRLDQEGVVLVTGPSGSGKSSLVLAGVLPLIARDRTRSLVFRPAAGTSPWRSIAASLIDLTGPDTDMEELSDRMRGGGLEDVLNRVLIGGDLRRLTVVLDQFDEGSARAPGDSRELLAALLDARDSHRREPRIDLVITSTTEALDDILADQHFGHRLSGHVVTVAEPGPPELREIIEKPLAAVGMPVYEPGLVDVLVTDVREERNPLPLLEFTLTLLWEQQRHGLLTHETYRELGGIAGALATYADRICQAYLTDDSGGDDLRWVLSQLISPVGADRVVRRVVELDQLGTRAELARELAASRLVTLGTLADGRSSVELAHEALVQHWPRLRAWVAEDRDFRAWQDDLDRQAERWHGARDKGYLLRGKALKDTQGQARRAPRDLTRRQHAFLDASTRAARVRWFRGYCVTMVIVMVAALVTGVTWINVRHQEDQNAVNAAQSLLTMDQQNAGTARPIESMALQVRAFRTHDDPGTRQRISWLASELRYATAVVPGSARYTGAQQPINADASGVVLTDPDGNLVAWNLTGRHPARVVIPVHDPGSTPGSPVASVAWVGSGRLLTSYTHGPSIMWDARTGRIITRLPVGGDVLATSADGGLLAYGNSGDRALRVVSLARPGAAPRVIRLPGPVNPGSQSLPGQVSVTDLLSDGDLLVRSQNNLKFELIGSPGTRILPVPRGTDEPDVQVVDEGGNRQAIVSCGTSGDSTVFAARSLRTGKLLGQYGESTAANVTDCEHVQGSFTADGRYLALTSGGATDSELPASTDVGPVGGPAQTIPTPPGYQATRTVMEPDGTQRVVLTGFDSMIVLEVPKPAPMIRAQEAAVKSQVYGKYLLLADREGRITAWDTATRRETGSVQAASARVAADDNLQIVADPGGDVIATSDGAADSVRLWRLPGLTPAGDIHLATPPGYFDAGVQARISGARLFVTQWQTRHPFDGAPEPGRAEFTAWDLHSLRLTAKPTTVSSDNVADNSNIGFLLPDPDGTELVQNIDNEFRRVRLSNGTVVPGSSFTVDGMSTAYNTPPAFDPSGRFIGLAYDYIAEIWDLDSGKQVARLALGQNFHIFAIAFSGSSHTLEMAVGGDPMNDGTMDMVQTWNWKPFLGIPALFGIKSSTLSTVNDPSRALVEEGELTPSPDAPGSINPQTWLNRICQAWYPNSLDTATASLPANSWTGPICPART